MEIGIVGGTGPAGTALAARLASVGLTVFLGSRSRYRAMEATDGVLERWPDRELDIRAVDNHGAAGAKFVVLATPWEAAAVTARSVEDQLSGKIVVTMANALERVGNEFIPSSRPAAVWRQACRPWCRSAGSPPPSSTSPPTNSAISIILSRVMC